jgi:hypothetical protein
LSALAAARGLEKLLTQQAVSVEDDDPGNDPDMLWQVNLVFKLK